MRRIFFAINVIVLFSLSILQFPTNSSVALVEPVIKIVDAKTGLNSTSLGSPTIPMPSEGYPFTVNVFLDGSAEDLFLYQIGIKFNTTLVRCDAAWIAKNSSGFVTDPNSVFYNKRIQQGGPEIDNTIGYVVIGASLLDKTNVATESQKIFCKMNFTAIKTGTFALEHILQTDLGDPLWGLDTFLCKLYNNLPIDIPFVPQGFSGNVFAYQSPPVASFTFNPKNPIVNQTVTFDASSSYDSDGSIVSYLWDFYDGNVTTTTNVIITHAFTSNAVYDVKLTVFDNNGLNSSIVLNVLVGGIPYVSFTYYPSEPYCGDTINFNASTSFDLDGEIVSYVWDFDDGNITTTSEATITHIFVQNSIYSTNLKVFDNDGLYNSTTQQVFVGKPPIANFTFSPENPIPDEEIIFDASLSYDTDGWIVSAIWDFGDFNVAEVDITEPTDFAISHTYVAQGGVYPVNLTVFDNDGLHASMVYEVNVYVVFAGFTRVSVIFNVVWERVVYKVVVSSNSTVSHFNFAQQLKQISFEASGGIGTTNYCNVTVPKTLLNGNPWAVKISEQAWSFTVSENATHSFIYFTYTHASTLQVIIQGTWVVPEFSSTTILPLFMILTMLIAVFTKKNPKHLALNFPSNALHWHRALNIGYDFYGAFA